MNELTKVSKYAPKENRAAGYQKDIAQLLEMIGTLSDAAPITESGCAELFETRRALAAILGIED